MAKRKAWLAISILLLCGCCSKRHTAVAVETRHADSVATMESIRAHTFERETVTEVLCMRRDSAGNLQVVSRDIVRTTDRGGSTLADTTRAEVKATADVRSEQTETTVTPPARERTPWWPIAVCWTLMVALVTGCAFLLVRKGGKEWISRD